MDNILDDAKKFYKSYLTKAEETYGKLPEYCYKTQFKLVDDKDELMANVSGADLIENCIYVNPNVSDLEWLIYHEMEHIRNATNLGKTQETGFYVKPDYEKDDYVGECINEALTEISVEHLLGRSQKLVGYYEAIAVTRQLSACLGLSEEELLEYYDVDGRERLSYVLNNMVGSDTYFEELDDMLEHLHQYHMDDMNKEFYEFGAITKSPLGIYESDNTKFYRSIVQRKLVDGMKWAVKNGNISEEEYNKRLEKFNEISPYIQNQNQSE